MVNFFKKKHPVNKETAEPVFLPREDIDIKHPSSEKEKKIVQEVLEKTGAAIEAAARISLKDIQLLEEGRCINCGKKTEQYLETYVCRYCGWFSYVYPKEKGTMIHLKDQTTINCDRIYTINTNDILCIKGRVVVARIPRENVNYMEMLWTEEELEKKYQEEAQEKFAACDWCSKEVERLNTSALNVAFGRDQETYYFCTENCREAFKKQYPPRIHRNCYDKKCEECEECEKK